MAAATGTATPPARVDTPIEVDYLRQSSLNRKVYDLNADVTFKLGRKAGSVNAIWKYKNIDREYYQVALGETKTTTNILGAQWRPRPARGASRPVRPA